MSDLNSYEEGLAIDLATAQARIVGLKSQLRKRAKRIEELEANLAQQNDDDDFHPATAGDDPIWLGGVEYITKSRSDDLVKRLRDLGDHASFEPHMHHTAADRIKQLEAENQRLGQQCEGLMRAGMNNGQALILAEAKLAVAVEALEYIYDGHSAAGRNPQLMANKAEDTLAAIMERKDD